VALGFGMDARHSGNPCNAVNPGSAAGAVMTVTAPGRMNALRRRRLGDAVC